MHLMVTKQRQDAYYTYTPNILSILSENVLHPNSLHSTRNYQNIVY